MMDQRTGDAMSTIRARPDDWAELSPRDAGLDPAKLQQAAAAVRRIETRFGFLVVKDGAVVHETSYQGDVASRHQGFSITKGFAASLVGIPQTEGYLNVKDN